MFTIPGHFPPQIINMIDKIIEDNYSQPVNLSTDIIATTEAALEAFLAANAADLPSNARDFSSLALSEIIHQSIHRRPEWTTHKNKKYVETKFNEAMQSNDVMLQATAIVNIVSYGTHHPIVADSEYKRIGAFQWAMALCNRLLTLQPISNETRTQCLLNIIRIFIEDCGELYTENGFRYGLRLLITMSLYTDLEAKTLAKVKYYLARKHFNGGPGVTPNTTVGLRLFAEAYNSNQLSANDAADCLLYIAKSEKDIPKAQQLFMQALAIPGLSDDKKEVIYYLLGNLFSNKDKTEESTAVALDYYKKSLQVGCKNVTTIDTLTSMLHIVAEQDSRYYDEDEIIKLTDMIFQLDSELRAEDPTINTIYLIVAHRDRGKLCLEKNSIREAIQHFEAVLSLCSTDNDVVSRLMRSQAHWELVEPYQNDTQNPVTSLNKAIAHAERAIDLGTSECKKTLYRKTLVILLNRKKDLPNPNKKQLGNLTNSIKALKTAINQHHNPGNKEDHSGCEHENPTLFNRRDMRKNCAQLLKQKTGKNNWKIFLSAQGEWCANAQFEHEEMKLLEPYFQKYGVKCDLNVNSHGLILTIRDFYSKLRLADSWQESQENAYPDLIQNDHLIIELKKALRFFTHALVGNNPLWEVRLENDSLHCQYQTTELNQRYLFEEKMALLRERIPQIETSCSVLGMAPATSLSVRFTIPVECFESALSVLDELRHNCNDNDEIPSIESLEIGSSSSSSTTCRRI